MILRLSNIGMRAAVVSTTAVATATRSVLQPTMQDSFRFTASTALVTSNTGTTPASRLSNAGQRTMHRCTAPHRAVSAVSGFQLPVQPPPAPASVPPEPSSHTRHAASRAVHATPPTGRKRLEKLKRSIQSIDNYDLIRAIPVTIEPLGENVFVADSQDFDLSVTGRTADEAVELLKEMIVRIYEGNRSRKNTLDAARARQIKTMETFIGKAKGMWHWA